MRSLAEGLLDVQLRPLTSHVQEHGGPSEVAGGGGGGRERRREK